MKSKKYLIFLLLVSLVAVLFMGPASAADTYVNGSIADDTGHTGLSWDQAFNTIREGYDTVTDGSTVNIAPGTYTGNDNKIITVNKNITIQGAGANQTIIDLQDADYAFRVANYKNVTIKDLTIQNGNNEPNNGAALFNYNYANLTVINVIFKDNKAGSGGAIDNFYGNLTVIDCTFTGNNATSNEEGAGGGAIYNTGNLIITGSTFNGNNAQDGGAIYSWDTMNLIDCSFTGNTATGNGGAIISWITSSISHCLFTGNNAAYGGAIYNRDGTLTVTGCNIAGNTANTWGGALFNWDWIIAHYNRIVGNTATSGSAIYNAGSSRVDAENNWWGSNSDPKSITNLFAERIDYIYSNPWLMLNIYADPSTIYTGQTSKITANVYTNSNGVDNSADTSQFFSGPEITFTTNLGTIGSNSITVPWVLGQAIRSLLANEGPGVATVTAADGQIRSTTVIMLQAPVTPSGNEVNAASNTVGMQKTGTPIAGLVLAILALFGGLASSKRK